MLERENESIIRSLVERTIGSRSSYHLEETIHADIPRAVKAYFQAEVERWLERDLRGSQTFARVDDQATPYVEHVTATFLRSVSAAYSFTSELFLNTLTHAVHFAENYLCRPRWTLENFLFDEKDILLLHEFRSKLKYLAEYKYFATLLERIAQEKGWLEIRGADIRPLIHKIDDEVVRAHGVHELSFLTRPIFEFILLGKDPLTKPISLEPLLVFFEDKKMSSLREYIESICHVRKRTDLSLSELDGIIEDFFPEQKQASIVRAVPEAPVQPPQATSLMETPATAAPHVPEPPPPAGDVQESEPLEQEQEAAPEAPTPKRKPPATSLHKRENVPLALTYAGLPESPKQQSLPDLLVMLSKEQRDIFVRKLFAHDDAYFSGVMTALNSLESWKEASLYLSNFYDVHGLDPYADEVIEFTDIVHQRYTSATRPVK